VPALTGFCGEVKAVDETGREEVLSSPQWRTTVLQLARNAVVVSKPFVPLLVKLEIIVVVVCCQVCEGMDCEHVHHPDGCQILRMG